MRFALVALGAALAASGCARSDGIATGRTTGQASGYTVSPTSSFQGYIVTDSKGRRFLCRGQTGRGARVALENALTDDFVLRRRTDVVTTASDENYDCTRG